ncbi:MAG TPA: DNA-binding protein [Gammaproteobacteria bacterium]|nr:DNA-binding protein [Gammaproteobacteria bacterium]
MASLIVRNIDDSIANALKLQARKHGISAEAEHRRILEQVLARPEKRSFLAVLAEIPDVGRDADFERVQSDSTNDVFD